MKEASSKKVGEAGDEIQIRSIAYYRQFQNLQRRNWSLPKKNSDDTF